MADPKVPEQKLTSQGQFYQRVSKSDEKAPEVQSEYRGHGATPQQKEDENKPWLAEGPSGGNRDGPSRHQYDVYAQELDERLGPIAFVKDKIADTVEIAIEKASATSDNRNSATGTFSQAGSLQSEQIRALLQTRSRAYQQPPPEMDASSVAEIVKQQITKTLTKVSSYVQR